MKLLSEFLPKNDQNSCRARSALWSVNVFPQWTTSKMTPETRLGDILLDLMLIAMYGDEHESDYEKLGKHIAAET